MSAIADDDFTFFAVPPEDTWAERDEVVQAELSVETFHDEGLLFMIHENFEYWNKDRVACVSLNREQVVSLAERLLELAKEMRESDD